MVFTISLVNRKFNETEVVENLLRSGMPVFLLSEEKREKIVKLVVQTA